MINNIYPKNYIIYILRLFNENENDYHLDLDLKYAFPSYHEKW